jgi:hypothetical protein
MELPDKNVNNEQQQQQEEEEEQPELEPGLNPEVHEMHRALVCIGLSHIAAQEFIMNGITSTKELRTLDTEDLNCLIQHSITIT